MGRDEPGNPSDRGADRQMSVTEEILDLLKLNYDDWNCEGALPINPAMVSLAIETVTLTERQVRQEGLQWVDPEVGPDPEGGVDLSWETDRGYFLLILRPDMPEEFVCVRKRSGEEPALRRLCLDTAQAEALDLLRGNA